MQSATRIQERSDGGVHVLDIEGPITSGDGASLFRTRIRSLVQSGYTRVLNCS